MTQKLRDIVTGFYGNEWYLAHKRDIDFELNHLELHDMDEYVLMLHNKGIRIDHNEHNSNILYLLDITSKEPLERIECVGGAFPDIDWDTEQHRRVEVFDYLKEKYGSGFAHIGTFSTFKTKNLFKDCLRIFDIPFEESNKISKLLPDNPTDERNIKECLESIPEFKRVYDENQVIHNAIDFAVHMQSKGAIRQTGVHACLSSHTQLLTTNGFIPIKDLSSIESFEIINAHGVHSAKAFISGQKEVFKLEIASSKYSNKKIFEHLTFDHKVLTEDGWFNGTDLLGKFLKAGCPTFSLFHEFLGWSWNDGNYNSTYNRGHAYFTPKQDKTAIDRFQQFLQSQCARLDRWSIKSHIVEEVLSKHPEAVLHTSEKLPPLDLSNEESRSFLKGFFSANCSVQRGGIRLKITSFEMIKFISETLFLFNIDNSVQKIKGKICNFPNGEYQCKDSYQLEIGPQASYNFLNEIGLIQEYKIDKIHKVEVLSVTSCGIQTVYDFTVDTADEACKNGITPTCVVHNCGVILSDNPLDDLIPLWSSQDAPVAMFDGDTLEKIGFVKSDILGLKTLSVIGNTVRLIKDIHGITIDVNNIPDHDEKAYKLIADGNVLGLFQVEGNMAKFAIAAQPKSIEDLAAISALYRPGPMGMGYLEKYLDRKKGREECDFDIPEYNYIFKDSYGLMIYQEGVMILAQEMSDFTDIEVDVLRKAIGKKNLKLLSSLKGKLVSRAVAKGISEEVLEIFWENLLAFGSYAFNKSHSVSYALITYQTAWLKAHYPSEFMASLISLESEADQAALYIENAKQMGINVLPPDINQSGRDFSISLGGDILFGFSTVKNLGDKAVQQILDLQPFNSFGDFLIKTSGIRNINKKVYEVLIKCGACDFFGFNRSAMLANFELYISDWNKNASSMSAAEFEAKQSDYFNNDQYPEMPLLDILKWEKDLVGIYISGTPFDIVEQAVKISNSALLEDLENKDHYVGSIICQLTDFKKHKAPSGEMAFLTITDKKNYTSNEFVVFPRQYQVMSKHFVKESFLLISFKMETKNGKKSCIVEQVANLNERVGVIARSIAKKAEINHIDVIISGIPSTPRMKTVQKVLQDYISDTPSAYTVNVNCVSSNVIYNFGHFYLKNIGLDTIRAFNAIQDIHVSRGSRTNF